MTSWTTPSTQTTNTLITQTMYNDHIINNSLHLFTAHSVKCLRTTNQTITNNLWTAVLWDSEEHDTDAFHSTSTNTELITIPTGLDGLYDIKANVRWDNDATPSGQRMGRIMIDGTVNVCQFGLDLVSVDTEIFIGGAVDIVLNAAQTIELEIYQSSGASLDAISGNITYLSATWRGNA